MLHVMIEIGYEDTYIATMPFASTRAFDAWWEQEGHRLEVKEYPGFMVRDWELPYGWDRELYISRRIFITGHHQCRNELALNVQFQDPVLQGLHTFAKAKFMYGDRKEIYDIMAEYFRVLAPGIRPWIRAARAASKMLDNYVNLAAKEGSMPYDSWTEGVSSDHWHECVTLMNAMLAVGDAFVNLPGKVFPEPIDDIIDGVAFDGLLMFLSDIDVPKHRKYFGAAMERIHQPIINEMCTAGSFQDLKDMRYSLKGDEARQFDEVIRNPLMREIVRGSVLFCRSLYAAIEEAWPLRLCHWIDNRIKEIPAPKGWFPTLAVEKRKKYSLPREIRVAAALIGPGTMRWKWNIIEKWGHRYPEIRKYASAPPQDRTAAAEAVLQRFLPLWWQTGATDC